MYSHSLWRRAATALWILGLLIAIVGCSHESDLVSGPAPTEEEELLGLPGVEQRNQSDATPPDGRVTVSLGSASIEVWPYTGNCFDGTPVDPVNVIFTGQVDPLQIRAALLSLDGNRTAFGFPDAYPFNATWSDAIGDVQTAWGGTDGWTANYVQLQCGQYDPVRFHLRLFETNSPHGGGAWTIGAAHFELMIPGTADHQVLHWDLAEQLVVVDLLRSGLLDPALPMVQTDVIGAAPTFREIPAVIYNGLPRELQVLILGPSGPAQVIEPVGIPTDGRATILNVAQAMPVATGNWQQVVNETYEQVVPKPICNDGTEYVLVQGPVRFERLTRIVAHGRYSYSSSYSGTLTITPWDVITNQPAGSPYTASVGGHQTGRGGWGTWGVDAYDLRVAREPEGTEFLITSLAVGEHGPKWYHTWSRCLESRL